jgi:hypothetical protein
MFDFNGRMGKHKLAEFAQVLIELQEKTPFRISSRGWCYAMETHGYIDKSQFNKVDDAIKRCRLKGLIPVDFVAADSGRDFYGIEIPSYDDTWEMVYKNLDDVLTGYRYYTPDWWEGEEYYIQCVVEKVDLRTLFKGVCTEYHIPIANSAGWSSILQRAQYAKRFAEAEKRGMKCVLLYAGDFDPDGLRISDTIYKNLEQLADVRWADGTPGFHPNNLIIERFGLNYEFIVRHGYTWIDNLVTGAKIKEDDRETKSNDLSDPRHVNNKLPYVREYIANYGVRKCESNALVTTPDVAANLIRSTIENYLGDDALNRFEEKTFLLQEKYEEELERTGVRDGIVKMKRVVLSDEE